MEPPEELRPTTGNLQKRGSTFSLLVRNRDFRLLFAAMVVSFAGDWFLFVALAGLVFSLTQSPALVAAQFVAMTVPFALFTFVGGPLSDRLNRQILMVGSDVLRGVLALGFFLVDGPSDLWIVFLLTGLISALQAVFEPAALAALPNLVERKDLPAANVLAAATWGTMLTVGSALGGLVVTAFGRGAAYVGDAASFLASAILVTQIRRPFAEPREPHPKHPGLLEATMETLRYARKDHRVLALLTVKAGFGLGAGVIALIPVLAFQVFHAGDRGTGILMAFRGIGIVVGPFLIRPFVRDEDLRTVFWAIALSFAVFGLSYAVVPWMPSIYLAGLLILAGHLGGGVQWTLSSYGLQLLVPDHIRGRILAFDYGLIELTVAGSATLAGLVADYLDVRVVIVGLAAVASAYAVIWTAATTGIRRSIRTEVEPATA